MISLAADLAFEAKKPLSYMDSTLTGWAKDGLKTPEAVKKERKDHAEQRNEPGKRSSVRGVSAQQYQQRDYSHEQDEAMERMLNMKGGEENA